MKFNDCNIARGEKSKGMPFPGVKCVVATILFAVLKNFRFIIYKSRVMKPSVVAFARLRI